MTILQHAIAQAATSSSYQIARSLRFNSADSAYLSRTPASAGNRKTFTISFWVKRSKLGVTQKVVGANNDTSGSNQFNITFSTSDTLSVFNSFSYPTRYEYETSQVFRDVSAWYHIVLAVDTTQASSSNRFKFYVNGSQVTAFSVSVDGGQNTDWQWNSNVVHGIGAYVASVSQNYSDVYIADFRNIDGQALTPSSFGETDANTGVWVPKAYTGTYGTNGFWLKFDDNSGTTSTTLGKDSSGNGNNFTPNNFSVTAGVGNDSLVDSPTNYGTDTGAGGEVRGNYATMNPLATVSALTSLTLANGNLQLDYSRAGGQSAVAKSTFALPSSGKFYYEMNIISASSTPSNLPAFDAGLVSANAFSTTVFGGLLRTMYLIDGTKYDGTTYSTYGASFAVGDVVNIAVDMDNGRIFFGKNGSWANGSGAFNQTFGSATAAFTDLISSGVTWNPGTYISGGTAGSYYFNFGQRPFAYTAPSGFKALCTQNLPTPAIGASASTLANKYFNTVLYTGNGSTLNVTGVGFQPDLVWLKDRSTANSHALYDVIRGATKSLYSNATNAETTESTTLTAFGSDGFSLGSEPRTNTNTNAYVSWNWKANGAGVSNTAGSITSTVSANTTAGISVVTYTGNGALATIGHGLGAAPRMIIVKNRGNGTIAWVVYHVSTGKDAYLQLNATNASTSTTNYWGSANPTSTVFGADAYGGVNSSANTYVAYCFAEVAGFSRFGSFTGNGSADGAFVYCGFRPRWILVKSTAIENWIIHDTARDDYNVTNKELIPNSAGAEGTTTPFDILSNGFKMRANNNALNASGQTYIFAAFAEAPFNYARAR